MNESPVRPAYMSHADFGITMSALESGDLDSAMEASERLCQTFPGEPAVLDLKATVFMEAGEHDRARRLWGTVVDRISDQVTELERAHDGEDAAWGDVVQKCATFEADRLALLSISDGARLNAAICRDRMGDRQACVSDLAHAVKERSESVFLHAMLALLYEDENRHQEAKDACRAALRLPELSALASDWQTLAEACETVGLVDEATSLRRRLDNEGLTSACGS